MSLRLSLCRISDLISAYLVGHMVANATVANRTARSVTEPVSKAVDVLMAAWYAYLMACTKLRAYMDEEAHVEGTRLGQGATAKRVGKGLVTIGLIVVVLNEVFSINAINNSTGPFAGVIGTVESLGTAALTILAVGFIILAGAVAMGFMDSF